MTPIGVIFSDFCRTKNFFSVRACYYFHIYSPASLYLALRNALLGGKNATKQGKMRKLILIVKELSFKLGKLGLKREKEAR